MHCTGLGLSGPALPSSYWRFTMSNPASRLSPYVTKEEFVATQRVLPSVTALRWNMRVLGPQLRAAKAIVRLAGKDWIHPEKYEAVLLCDSESATGEAA